MTQAKEVSQTAVIVFPIVTTVLASLFVPASTPLVGMLMFGNLLKESGVTDRLYKTAGGDLINVVTIFSRLGDWGHNEWRILPAIPHTLYPAVGYGRVLCQYRWRSVVCKISKSIPVER